METTPAITWEQSWKEEGTPGRWACPYFVCENGFRSITHLKPYQNVGFKHMGFTVYQAYVNQD